MARGLHGAGPLVLLYSSGGVAAAEGGMDARVGLVPLPGGVQGVEGCRREWARLKAVAAPLREEPCGELHGLSYGSLGSLSEIPPSRGSAGGCGLWCWEPGAWGCAPGEGGMVRLRPGIRLERVREREEVVAVREPRGGRSMRPSVLASYRQYELELEWLLRRREVRVCGDGAGLGSGRPALLAR